jgi:allantoinase
MPEIDLLIRNGIVVTPAGVATRDISVSDGKIVECGGLIAGKAGQVIDVSGLHIFPGLIDSHVHFNDPGRADWEGFVTGSSALAAGGGTLFFDMPLNASPPTLDAESFDQKHEAARGKSLVDFAFWGGVVPGNLDHLEELAERGVVGFKAFMSNSGIEDFPASDEKTLREGMKKAARLKKIVAVHAESEEITARLTRAKIEAGQWSVKDYLETRPLAAELEAVRQILDIAGETGCALHIVHVSSGAGAALVATAAENGVDVTCETCPHYLALTAEDMVSIGARAKCAPPLRGRSEQSDLWHQLMKGKISTIGSDHSPSPASMKAAANFFKVWGGIAGIQHTLPLLLTEAHANRGMPLPTIARLTSANVAQRFRLPPSKAGILPGADADLVFVDLTDEYDVRPEELLDRHKLSPYTGRRLTGRVVRTILRGRTVLLNNRVMCAPAGQLVKPLYD